MTLRSYLWGLRSTALIAMTAWGCVLFFVSPSLLGAGAYILFYITFFVMVTSIGTLFLTWLVRRQTEDAEFVEEIHVIMRQGVIFGTFMTLLLLMQQLQILAWWSALLVLAFVLLVELFFLTRE